MRLIYSIAVLILLSSAAAAQLEPDKERFDVVLHPGEVEEKTLKVSNAGDAPIFKISNTPVSGSAKDYVFWAYPKARLLSLRIMLRSKSSSPYLRRRSPDLMKGSSIYWIALRPLCPLE